MGVWGPRLAPSPAGWALRRQHSLEHGNEEVQQQDVGEKQVKAEQDDGQPLGEGRLVPDGVALGALGLVAVCAIGAALVQAEIHTWGGQGTKKPHRVTSVPWAVSTPGPGRPHSWLTSALSDRERRLSTPKCPLWAGGGKDPSRTRPGPRARASPRG